MPLIAVDFTVLEIWDDRQLARARRRGLRYRLPDTMMLVLFCVVAYAGLLVGAVFPSPLVPDLALGAFVAMVVVTAGGAGGRVRALYAIALVLGLLYDGLSPDKSWVAPLTLVASAVVGVEGVRLFVFTERGFFTVYALVVPFLFTVVRSAVLTGAVSPSTLLKAAVTSLLALGLALAVLAVRRRSLLHPVFMPKP